MASAFVLSDTRSPDVKVPFAACSASVRSDVSDCAIDLKDPSAILIRETPDWAFSDA